jgi:hypothetical protein
MIQCISMDIPCIYCMDIHGISMDIPCISMEMVIHGISMDIPCISMEMVIHGISMDIPCISMEMVIHGISMDIHGICHVYVGHLHIHGTKYLHIHGIYHVHLWYILIIRVLDASYPREHEPSRRSNIEGLIARFLARSALIGALRCS